MPPVEIAAWGGFAVLVIGALATAIATVITALSSLSRIESKVDGAASVSVAKISSLQDNVTTLHGIIADRKEVAAVLAANVSSTDQVKASNLV